jgi:hypothetical protein
MPPKSHQPPATTIALLTSAEAIEHPLYLWDIPGDTGYYLRIEVADAKGEDEARIAALEYQVPLSDTVKRSLNALESTWVISTAPQVVRDTTDVTLDLDTAIRENERLRKENKAFAETAAVFGELGIDPYNPRAFITSVQSQSAQRGARLAADLDTQRKELAENLERVMDDLRTLAKQTGFAQPEPQPASEPDYSALTIVVPDESAVQQYPRLRGANFIAFEPGEPLTSDEREGLEMLTKPDGIIEEYWRSKGSERDVSALKAAQKRIRAEVAL